MNKKILFAALTLAFLFLGAKGYAQTPVITSVTPNHGKVGDTITISGSNFSTTLTNNLVYFGATKGTVISASATSLRAIVDTGATYAPIYFQDISTNLSCLQNGMFLPEFNNSYFIQGGLNFINPSVTLYTSTGAVPNSPYTAVIGDFNDDGKPDIAVNGRGSNTVVIFKNISTPGSITSSSFSWVATLAEAGSLPTNIKIADIDVDGLPDIVTSVQASSRITVYRNTSSTSTISFATGVSFSEDHIGKAPNVIAIADMDGDGRPEIAVSSRDSTNFVVFRNLSTPGSINSSSMATPIAITSSMGNYGICAVDFNNDGKADIAMVDTVFRKVSIFKNTSSGVGVLSFAARDTFSVGSYPSDLQVGDIDGDGKIDLLVANSNSGTLSVLRNTTASSTITFATKVDFATDSAYFASFGASSAPVGIGTGDLDGDGKPDVVVSNAATGDLSIFRNTSTSGSITSSSLARPILRNIGGNPLGVNIGDLDGDGYPEVVIGQYYYGYIKVLRNYPLPYVARIMGVDTVCVGTPVNYTDSTSGGLWSVSNTSLATIHPTTGALTTTAAGIDTVYYRIFAGGDSNRVMRVLTIQSNPVVSPIMGAANVCVGSTTTMTDSTIGGAWASSDTTKARISTSGVVTGVARGTVTLSYTVTNTCSTRFDTATINVIGLPVAGTITGPSSVCPGATITLTDTATGGVWTSDSTTRATVNPSTGVVTGVSVGHPTIIYTVSNACGSTNASFPITVSTTVSAGSITGASSVCEGATTTFSNATTGGSWSSSDPSVATINSSGVITGLSGGSATITYTISAVCGTATTTKNIIVNRLPVAGPISGVSSVCMVTTPTTTLTDTTISGSWSSTNPSVATINASGLLTAVMPGTTTIVFTSTNSCGTDTANKSFLVDSTVDVGIITGATTICIGTPVTFTESATGGTWTTSNAAIASVTSAGVVSGVSNGSATISYSRSNTCGARSATQNISVTNSPAAGVISGTTTLCESTTTALSSTVSGGVWSSVNMAIATVTSTTGLVFGIAAGNDTIIYTVTNSCGTATASTTITVTPAPNAGTVSGPTNLCVGLTGVFTNTVSGGTWSTSNTAIATVNTTGTATAVAAGTVSIRYAVTNGCGTATAVKTLNVLAVPVAGAITGPSSVCVNASVTEASTPSGGVWRLSNARATVTTAGVVTGVASGSDTLMYILSNACGTDTSFRTLTINPLADTGDIVGLNSVCVGNDIFLTNAATGGAWGIGSGFTYATVSTTGVVTGLTGGVAVVTYTGFSAACGNLHASHIVFVTLPADAGNIAGRDTLCPGEVDTLFGGYGVTWLTSNTSVATVNSSGWVTAVAAGDVTIYNVDSNGCSTDTARLNVHVNPGTPFPGVITGLDSGCLGATATLSDTVMGGTWSSSNTGIATVTAAGIVTGVAAGASLISYTVANSCGSAVAVFQYRVAQAPQLTSILTTEICDTLLFTYTASTDSVGVSIAWGRAAVSFINNTAATGTGNVSEYLDNTADSVVHVTYVYTTAKHGCADTVSVVVSVKPTPYLTSPLNDTVCSGAPFTYQDAENTGISTSALWTRATVANISPATNNGSHAISETLTNSTLSNVSVVYVYTLTFNGCSNTQKVTLSVQPSPVGPQITTHAPGSVCSQTSFQNFGTATPPPIGVNYTWTATGAEVWATGTTRQYSLVNFNTPGNAVIHLLASISGNNCPNVTDYNVTVGTGVSDKPEVIYYNGDFICLANDRETYQWGVDNAGTLDSTVLSGQTNQNYTNSNPDFTHNHYWVMTTHDGCMQKTYYSTPLSVVSTSKMSSGVVEVAPNPNEGNFTMNLLASSKENVDVVFTNIVGQVVKTLKLQTNTPAVIQLDVPAGVYFVSATTETQKFNSKIVIAK